MPIIYGGSASSFNPAAVAITGGTGIPIKLLESGVSLIHVSSGSMANNGAMSGLTALPFTYANCYVLLPANAIAAGTPAADTWYFAQMSSATAGTVFNNLLSANLSSLGEPLIPASPTAFVTTGPGAFAGSTAEVAALTITIPANALGAKGQVHIETEQNGNATAGAKNLRVRYSGGAGTVLVAAQSTTTGQRNWTRICNRGTGAQYCSALGFNLSGGAGAGVPTAAQQTAIDTTASSTVVITLQKATATDHTILEYAFVTYLA